MDRRITLEILKGGVQSPFSLGVLSPFVLVPLSGLLLDIGFCRPPFLTSSRPKALMRCGDLFSSRPKDPSPQLSRQPQEP